MTRNSPLHRALRGFGLGLAAACFALVLASACLAAASASAPPETAANAATPAEAKDTTPTKKDLIQPAELAKLLALPEKERPALVHVGFPVLYKGGHLAGSKFAGPGNNPKGRADFKAWLQTLPKDRAIVLYCGCCPWVHCPNVNPAFRIARSLGYEKAKILYIAKDMQRDWVDQGLPALVR